MGTVRNNRPSRKRGYEDERPSPKRRPDEDSRLDWREQTFNAGDVGPVEQVSTPLDLITTLRMIMVDIDPQHLSPKLFDAGKGTFASRLYHQTVRHWLDRDPLWSRAAVLNTGTGLHVQLHLDPVVEFACPADRDLWAAVVRSVQNTLPSDPNAPGLTALTRPVGSVNSKTGRAVKLLRPGTPVTPDAVLEFVDKLRRRPFATVAGILHGADRITPCPVCRADGSTLAALDRVGRCYARCGTVKLAQLFGTFMSDPSNQGEE